MWNEDNDGSGSGLDADTLDTIDSTGFCQSDGTNCPADDNTDIYWTGTSTNLVASTGRTSLGLVAGGAGDIWVEKAGDTMTGDLVIDGGTHPETRIRTSVVTGVPIMEIKAGNAAYDGLLLDLDDDDAYRASGNNNYAFKIRTVDDAINVATDSDTKFQVMPDGSTFINYGATNILAGNPIFAVNGNAAFSGDVGIGTTSPDELLHLYQTANDFSSIHIESTDTGTAAGTQVILEADGESFFIVNHGSGRTKQRYGITLGDWSEILSQDNNGLVLGTGTANNPIIFGNNDLERMRIDTGGNVGIGTTSPLTDLEVSGHVISSRDSTFVGATKTSRAFLEARVPITSVKTASELGIGVTDENDIDSNLAGERDSNIGCTSGVNYATAKSTVEGVGARLPTLEEAEGGAAEGTGCSFDSYHVWTQTKCGQSGVGSSVVNYYWITAGDPDSFNSLGRYCVAESDTTAPGGGNIAVEYVAEVSKAGLPLGYDLNGDVDIGSSDLDTTGTVTANAFVGDGSGLTNIDAGDVDMAALTDGTGITDFTYDGTSAASVSVGTNAITDTHLAYNTGQHLTTGSSPTFSALNLGDSADLRF
ncbi:MAG: hypothetical protein WDZ68_02160, partial [Candidatus Paceibacterota bacterium]